MKMVVICGNESSGNRFLYSTLIRASGWQCDDNISKEWWNSDKTIEPDFDRITFRSLPYYGINSGRKFLNVESFVNRCRLVYDTRIILTTRDVNIICMSKTKTHTCGDLNRAVSENIEANKMMRELLKKYSDITMIFSYETHILLKQPYLLMLYKWLGIDSDYTPTILDGNQKYLRPYSG